MSTNTPNTQPTREDLKQHVGPIAIGGNGQATLIGAEEKRFNQSQLDGAVKFDRIQRKIEVETSASKKKILELLATNSGPEIERVEGGDGNEFFIRKLDAEGLMRTMLQTPRNRKGMLDYAEKGHFSGLLAAMLFFATCADETGATPLFDEWEEAYDFAHSTNSEVVEISRFLFTEIDRINPEVVPKVKAPDKTEKSPMAGASQEDDAFLEQSEAEEAPPN